MIGFVNVYKPKGCTSFKIVGEIKRIYGIKHVGHLGTLDPMAEGVLPIAIGKATKFFDYFLKKDKKYIAEFRTGYLTDTLDADGEVVEKKEVKFSFEEIENACRNFVGKIQQTPPKFSAVKINGQRAYKLAREGKDFEIKPKEVEIYSILPQRTKDDNLFRFEIWCSAGTYIRSLGSDIFASFNVLATMEKLTRTMSGNFKIDNAHTIEEIKKDSTNALIAVENVLPNMKRIELNDELFFKLKNGVVQKFDADNGEYLAIHNNECVALVEIENRQMKCKINLM